jgi:hypothetical protein
MGVPAPIAGTAFFPGGLGLWCDDPDNLPPLPIGGVMVLGQDFNTKATYEVAFENGTELLTSTTFKKLLDLLESGT